MNSLRWQMLLTAITVCLHKNALASARIGQATPEMLASPLSKTFCVASAQSTKSLTVGPASYLVIYGQTTRYIGQLNSFVLAASPLSQAGQQLLVENFTEIAQNVILVYDADTLELVHDVTDERQAVESCNIADKYMPREECELQCAAYVNESTIVLSVLGKTEVREYMVLEEIAWLAYSAKLDHIAKPRLRKPQIVFNPFLGKNVLYFVSNDLLSVASFVRERGPEDRLSINVEYEIPAPVKLPYFLQNSARSISSIVLTSNLQTGSLVLQVLMENSLVYIKDLGGHDFSHMLTRLPYNHRPDILPALVGFKNNATWAFVSNGRISLGTQLVPLQLGSNGLNEMLLEENTVGTFMRKPRILLSTLQAGQRYVFFNVKGALVPKSNAVLGLDGKTFELTRLPLHAGTDRKAIVYSFVPGITGNYTLRPPIASSNSLLALDEWGYYSGILVHEYKGMLKSDLILCCTISKIQSIDAIQTQHLGDELRLVTTSTNGTVHVWNPRLTRPMESFFIPLVEKDLRFASYNSVSHGHRLVTFSSTKGAFQVWSIGEPATPRYTDGFVLVFNITVYIVAAMFVRFIVRALPRYKEKLFVDKKGKPTPLRKFLTYVGYRRSFRVFDVVALRDYIPLPKKLHFTTPVGNVQIGPNKLLLTAYLLFVLAIFNSSADIFKNLSASTKSDTCLTPENKLNAINREALKELNYFDTFELVEDAESTLARLSQEIIRLKRQSGNILFMDWPNGTDKVCNGREQEALNRAKSTLVAKCDAKTWCKNVFVRLDLSFWKILEWFFIRNLDNLIVDKRLCHPKPGTKVPCPIDTSVIQDLFALQKLFDKQQGITTPPLPQTVEYAEKKLMKELNYLLWLISLGNQIYIGYAVLRIYVVIPLNLYHSSLLNTAKRTFFTMSQLTFVVLVVFAMWTVPYLLKTLSFENLHLYLHNVHLDPCYMQPAFLAQVGKRIIDACTEVDNLEKQYYAVQYQTREVNLTANQYSYCAGSGRGYDNLQVFQSINDATELLNGTYPASTCTQDKMREISAKFAKAPGDQDLGFVGFLFSIGLILQLCPGFIFARFGLSFVRTMDPLLLHDGCVEIERRNDMVEEARKDIYQAKKRAKIEFLIKMKSDERKIRGKQNGKLDEAQLRKLEIETTGTGSKELLALCNEEIAQAIEAVQEKIDTKKKQREEELAEKLREIKEREVEMIEFGEQENKRMLSKIKLGLLEAQIITDFLYYQRLPSLIFNGILVYIYFASVLRVIVDPQASDGTLGDQIIGFPVLIGLLIWVCAKLCYRYQDPTFEEKNILGPIQNDRVA